ncbi:MAG: heme biosynthesis HemY N-terminal domain-containing protein [Gammaproteobacteria bacterium]|nr:heme biosynthesis HemY N-terminal domain-containing protein [Gammaproteobacteria bacterium]
MVKAFLILLLALGVGAYLSVFLAEDPGYVLVTFRAYSVEVTLGAAIISLIITYLVIIGLFKLLKIINPFKLFNKETWYRIFNQKNVRRQTELGWQKLLLGQWQDAYKLLVESANRAQVPSVNYLAAAYAAFQRKDQLACIFCLSQAKQQSLVSNSGIKTFQALLELKSGKEEQSLALLLAIIKEQPESPYALMLLKDIYVSLKDWKQLNSLLPELEKQKVLSNEELLNLKEQLAVHRLHKASTQSVNDNELKTIWSSFHKTLQKRELVMEAYLRALLSSGNSEEAVNLLTKFIKHQWSDRLIELLGYIDTKDAAEQILLVEGWVKDRPKNVNLMLTLGRLSLRNKLWGKAREYFELALRLSNNTRLSSEINAELGRLLEHLGEHEQSLTCYRQAINLMDRKLPDLPMPNLK